MVECSKDPRVGWRRRGNSGHAAVEIALMAPWIFFLFVGVLDFGFYAYSAISTQNAARAAALYTSSSDSVSTHIGDVNSGACSYVLAELKRLPNVKNITTCASLPVLVTAQKINPGVDGAPASRVSVTYRTPSMIPIPGIMAMQFVLTRAVEMRIKE